MKLQMLPTLAFIGLLLTSCSGSLETKARKALAGQLEGVDGAQFRNLTESKPAGKNGDHMICGEVKSKNDRDFTRFMVDDSGKGEAVFAKDPVSSAVFSTLLDTACKDGPG